MLPTPYPLDSERIRVLFGSTDNQLFGKTGALDLTWNDKLEIERLHPCPLLDLGMKGSFDDSGSVPSAVILVNGERRLLYSGFQRRDDIPYSVFSGLAKERRDGTWERISPSPVLGSTTESHFFRGGAFVLQDEGVYRMWYLAGQSWIERPGALPAPSYSMKYFATTHLDSLPESGVECLTPNSFVGQIGFCRPWVIKLEQTFFLWTAPRTRLDNGTVTYHEIAAFESKDGVRWTQLPESQGLKTSASGWDSEMVCYPSVIYFGGRLLMLYSGNGNGREGFGYAELVS